MSRAAIALSLVVAVFLTASARGESADELMKRGDEFYARKNYGEAAAAFERALAADPGDSRAWEKLGFARLRAGQSKEAIPAFQKALTLTESPQAMYGLGAAYSMEGNLEEAAQWAEKSLKTGFPAPQLILSDAVYAALRADKRFASLARLADELDHPCMHAAEYRQFDFWLGEWDVVSRQAPDRPPSRSSITRIEDGCAIREQYSTASGYSGTSLNFYDKESRKWHQTWIDRRGAPLFLSGGLSNGSMVLQSDPEKKPLNRITWSRQEGGAVRQVWEVSDDRGSSWSVIFDGTYTPHRSQH